jgi:Flp pilus assembly pilin Flp
MGCQDQEDAAVWSRIISLWQRLRGREGQGLVEYALLLALVALAVFGALTSLHHAAGNAFNTDSQAIGGAIGSKVN